MNLVEDDHLTCKREAPNEEVLHGHHPLKCLVNGPHTIRREQRTFGGSEPRTCFAQIRKGVVAICILVEPGAGRS